ncbi:hypothetical protein N9X39_01715, partial [Alphaproteobacteria bacterium]|nr:hypothetical protein [Alphaproteobacteria bacterium]
MADTTETRDSLNQAANGLDTEFMQLAQSSLSGAPASTAAGVAGIPASGDSPSITDSGALSPSILAGTAAAPAGGEPALNADGSPQIDADGNPILIPKGTAAAPAGGEAPIIPGDAPAAGTAAAP